MRRPHLTCRVMRGLEILIDVPPLLRQGRQKRDADRAVEYVQALRQWWARAAKRKPRATGATVAASSSPARRFGQLDTRGVRLKGAADPRL